MTELNQPCQSLDKNIQKAFENIKYCTKNNVWTRDLMKFALKFSKSFWKY